MQICDSNLQFHQAGVQSSTDILNVHLPLQWHCHKGTSSRTFDT